MTNEFLLEENRKLEKENDKLHQRNEDLKNRLHHALKEKIAFKQNNLDDQKTIIKLNREINWLKEQSTLPADEKIDLEKLQLEEENQGLKKYIKNIEEKNKTLNKHIIKLDQEINKLEEEL